jgi:cystathionine gamma-synthase
MGGSLTLNPLSPHYSALKALWKKNHANEFFIGDADVLLKNNEDYLARSAILNRNAAAMCSFLQKYAEDPKSPVAKVLYPAQLPDVEMYNSFKRRPTEEFPEPGYGCLFSVDFESLETAIAFYDKLGFYPGPHLGAHKTLSLCFNTLAFGKHKEEEAYHRTYGLLEESVRISAGLESEGDLIDTLKEALDVAAAVKAKSSA